MAKTTKGTQTLKEIQFDRIALFPKNRIPFYRNSESVTCDQRNFRQYVGGQITLDELCRLTAKNNYLPESAVTPEKMLNELRITGWIRD